MAFYIAPFLSLLYVALARGPVALYATLPLLGGSFAILDLACGLAPSMEALPGRLHDRLLPCLYIPLQLALTLFGAIAAARPTTGLATLGGLALSIGTIAGIFGMLAAHELIHSRNRVHRGLGIAMLAATTYMHFRISHVHLHHRVAATLADPATARRGESVYRFFLRSAAGQFRAALHAEHARAARSHHPHITNRMGHYAAVATAIYFSLCVFLGLKAVAFFALQSLTAVFILELFNYVVHYGLLRRVLPDSRIEPLTSLHSWNAPQRFTNWALMNGGYHSDHHRRPGRGYGSLSRVTAAPELPMGYAGMMILALVPPLWRAAMHPRLDRLARGAIPKRAEHLEAATRGHGCGFDVDRLS